MTDFNDPNAVADALDADADTYERVGSFAPNCTPKLRAAAVLLRRQGEALAALTDAIGDLDDAAIEATRLRHAAFHGASQRMFRIINAAAAVGSVDAAPTLDDTKERSDG